MPIRVSFQAYIVYLVLHEDGLVLLPFFSIDIVMMKSLCHKKQRSVRNFVFSDEINLVCANVVNKISSVSTHLHE